MSFNANLKKKNPFFAKKPQLNRTRVKSWTINQKKKKCSSSKLAFEWKKTVRRNMRKTRQQYSFDIITIRLELVLNLTKVWRNMFVTNKCLAKEKLLYLWADQSYITHRTAHNIQRNGTTTTTPSTNVIFSSWQND